MGAAPESRRPGLRCRLRPDAGQSIAEIGKAFPKRIGLDKLVPQPDGFLLLAPDGIRTAFAQDLGKAEQDLLIAVQPDTAGSLFAAEPTQAAWHSKPSWYIVASNDHMIAPEHEASMAKQIKATTTTLPSSHVVMLSHPKRGRQGDRSSGYRNPVEHHGSAGEQGAPLLPSSALPRLLLRSCIPAAGSNESFSRQ